MPSPKAVLRDIHDLKLDPKKAHTSIRSSGHLRKHHIVPAPVDMPVDVPKPALVKVAELEVLQPVTIPVEEYVQVVESHEHQVEVQPKKKVDKFVKKNDKKDKLDELISV